MLHGGFKLSQHELRTREIVQGVWIVRIEREGRADQSDGLLMLAGLLPHQSQQVKSLGVARVDLQHRAVASLNLGRLPGLVMLQTSIAKLQKMVFKGWWFGHWIFSALTHRVVPARANGCKPVSALIHELVNRNKNVEKYSLSPTNATKGSMCRQCSCSLLSDRQAVRRCLQEGFTKPSCAATE
jgi:hypothetical protein